MKQITVLEKVKLDSIVHGGQCIATITEGTFNKGKKLFVWGGLPGEIVDVRITKRKSSYLEGIVVKVINASKNRIQANEPNSYLSTSPWQIFEFSYENELKQEIINETFYREALDIKWADFAFTNKQFGYRNKLEIGFWGDENGLHLAHYVRDTHGKVIADNNSLVAECINVAARDLCEELNKLDIWAGKLKTLMLRSNGKSNVAGVLFIKEELNLENLVLPESLTGLDIYYSNPKSPASVPTKLLKSYGTTELEDEILGNKLRYSVLSFFQINLEIFEQALKEIKLSLNDGISIDMYSGVGTIGTVVGSEILVESDEQNIKFAKINAPKSKVIHASSEQALEYISSDKALIIDPPRAGLHADVVDKIKDILPPKVVYLSCNPSTQARDVKLLSEKYEISYARGYNFFPRTPHIESLLILNRK